MIKLSYFAITLAKILVLFLPCPLGYSCYAHIGWVLCTCIVPHMIGPSYMPILLPSVHALCSHRFDPIGTHTECYCITHIPLYKCSNDNSMFTTTCYRFKFYTHTNSCLVSGEEKLSYMAYPLFNFSLFVLPHPLSYVAYVPLQFLFTHNMFSSHSSST